MKEYWKPSKAMATIPDYKIFPRDGWGIYNASAMHVQMKWIEKLLF